MVTDHRESLHRKDRLSNSARVVVVNAVPVNCYTLFGADFCFSADKTHAGWEDGALSSPVATATHWVLNGMGNRAKTQPNFRSYLCELERYIARHPEIKFYNTSRIGALIDGTSFHPEFIK